MKLRQVAFYQPQIFGTTHSHVNCLGKSLSHDLHYLRQDVIWLQEEPVALDTASKAEHLPHDPSAALRARLHDVQEFKPVLLR